MTDKTPDTKALEKNSTTDNSKETVSNKVDSKKPDSKKTDSKKTDSKKTDSKKTESQSASKKAAPKKPLPLLTIGLSLFIILLLAILCGTAYFGWQYGQEQHARVAKVESQLDEQSTWFATAMKQQSTHLDKQRNSLSTLSQALEKDQKIIQQRLDAQAHRLAQLSGDNRDGWMLEETRYLLRLANQRQLTGGGVQGIIGLLESADKLLITLDTPDVFPLRDTIQKDILALKLAPVVDREGIYLQLAAFIERVDQLPPVPLKSSLQQPEESTVLEGSHWQDGLWESIQNAFGKLDQYVRVQQHDQPLDILVSGAQQQIIAQNLRLMLEQAQIALLREEGVIYEESLEQAIRWLHKHFSHFPEKQAFVGVLTELKRQNITSQLPDVSSSLKQLNLYIQSSRKAIEDPVGKSSKTEIKQPDASSSPAAPVIKETAL